MDIISEKPTAFTTEYTFRFVNREAYAVVLQDTDTITETDSTFVVTVVSSGTKEVETTLVYKQHLLTYSVRVREVVVFAKGESPIERRLAEIQKHHNPQATP